MKALFVCAALALLPGCATIVAGANHTMAVQTEPTGGACEVRRDGNLLGTVNPTPGTVTFEKASPPVVVACTAASGLAGSASFNSVVEPWVFGNIVFGGLIGAVVDLSTGATSKYPDQVTIALASRP